MMKPRERGRATGPFGIIWGPGAAKRSGQAARHKPEKTRGEGRFANYAQAQATFALFALVESMDGR